MSAKIDVRRTLRPIYDEREFGVSPLFSKNTGKRILLSKTLKRLIKHIGGKAVSWKERVRGVGSSQTERITIFERDSLTDHEE